MSAQDVRDRRAQEAAKGAAQVRERRDQARAEQAAQVSDRRAAQRQSAADDIRRTREEYRSAQAEKVSAKRGEWNAQQERNLETRKAALAEASTRELRRKAQLPEQAARAYDDGAAVARCHGYGIGIGIGLGFSWCSPYGWYWNSYWNNCWPAGGWWWGYGWNNTSYWGFGWGLGFYPSSWWCNPIALSYRCWWGGWPSYGYGYGWWPGAYTSWWGSAPVYYASELANSGYSEPSQVVIYVNGEPEVEVYQDGREVYTNGAEQTGEGVQYEPRQAAPAAPQGSVPPALERGPDSLSRAANQYLGLGDAAFRERRYADAVHYYAKAIEFRPNEGVMYLVLADALLATGDYHYGAFALRRALELDPTLAMSDIDKHEFYSNPVEFIEQLQLLERFLADHPGDGDARILLAANYLFGRKAALAIDLLEAGASAAARNEAAGKLILEAAKRAPR